MSTQSLYKDYADLKFQAKLIADNIEVVSKKILEDLRKDGMAKVELENLGTFTVCQKKSWKYTPAITKIAERLKIAQFKEQEQGKAKPIISEYLLYKGND